MPSKKMIRSKRGDTKIENIEKQYGVDFGVRGDMRLDTYLEIKGYPSMSKAIRDLGSQKDSGNKKRK